MNSYLSRNTLLKGILPGLVLSNVELLLEFVCGLSLKTGMEHRKYPQAAAVQ